jgi:hypothetical protein
MQEALGSWSDELSYRAFVGVNQLSHDAAAAVADLTIDIDRMSSDSRYRTDLRAHIFARTGLEIRFEDCRVGGHDTSDIAFDFAAVESEVVSSLKACGASVRAPHERFDVGRVVASAATYRAYFTPKVGTAPPLSMNVHFPSPQTARSISMRLS